DRDRRDVMVSRYFFAVRALTIADKLARASNIHNLFAHLYGRSYDVNAVRENLPKFIEAQFERPQSSDGLAWHEHIADWTNRPCVYQVSYEELLSDPGPAITRVVHGLTGITNEPLASLSARRWCFSNGTGRQKGEEDRFSFV